MQNSAYTKPIHLELYGNSVVWYSYYRQEKIFAIMKNIKKLKFEGDWMMLWPKFYLLRKS